MRTFLCGVWLIAMAVLLPQAGCSSSKGSTEFDRRFAAAKQESGLGEVQIVDFKAKSDLKNNVQRLGEPTPPVEGGNLTKPPAKLTQNQVGQHIRRQVARLAECQDSAKGRSGKAILTVKILSSGRVESVDVEAPAFEGTRLGICLREAALRWSFPRFQAASLSYSYPLIFR